VRKLVVTEFITVDGVVEDPGGSEGFERGGWAFDFDRGDEGDKFKLDELREAEAQLFGRRTYDGFAAAWPSRTGEFADILNKSPKYVVSSTLEEPPWENSTVISGDVAEEVSKLKAEPGGSILVAGSVQLVRTLLDNGLVDELRLMVFPLVLGKGKRLFDDGLGKSALELVESKPVGPDGVVTLVYSPADGSTASQATA
jgi:dihydrofolate reductase